MEVWQKGFSDHRIRDASDYRIHQTYVRENPVRKHLCEHTDEYPYSSAGSRFELDPAPQGLKPLDFDGIRTARLEGAPFQDNIDTLEEARASKQRLSWLARWRARSNQDGKWACGDRVVGSQEQNRINAQTH